MSFRLRDVTMACICILMVVGVIIGGVNAQEESYDRQLPEPILFLRAANDAMGQYYGEHRKYADQWYLLDITFANGPYQLTDEGIRPSKEDANTWKPLRCTYTYTIEFAEQYVFLIRAVNPEGAAACMLLTGVEDPLINITEESLFREQYRPAVADVAGELIKDEEEPSEFYADVERRGEDELIFHLWHQEAFTRENLQMFGDPGSKCRDFHYDTEQGKVVKKSFWQ